MWRLISCKVGPAGETADDKQKSREGRGKLEIKTSWTGVDGIPIVIRNRMIGLL